MKNQISNLNFDDEDDDTQVYQRPWQGLTDKERETVRAMVKYNQIYMTVGEYAEIVQKATEAKLRWKNS